MRMDRFQRVQAVDFEKRIHSLENNIPDTTAESAGRNEEPRRKEIVMQLKDSSDNVGTFAGGKRDK